MSRLRLQHGLWCSNLSMTRYDVGRKRGGHYPLDPEKIQIGMLQTNIPAMQKDVAAALVGAMRTTFC